jgi:ornithine--oxo-acid transaminase
MYSVHAENSLLADIRRGTAYHMDHYGGKRLPFACISANGLRQTLLRLDGPNAGQTLDVLDASGGYASACLGAGHPCIGNAFAKAFADCGYATDELASSYRSNMLLQLFGSDTGLWSDRFAPGEYHVSGRNSGSEGMELAMRLVLESSWDSRKLAPREGRKHKRLILAFEGAWHGWTAGVLPLINRRHFRVGIPNDLRGRQTEFQVHFIPFGDFEILNSFFAEHGDSLAGVVVEPVQGDAGILLPPNGYLRRLASLCREHEAYLVADEVLTFAKTGQFFAMTDEHGAIETDVSVIGKSLGFGAMPVSLVIARRNLAVRPSGAVATCDLRPLTCHLMLSGIQFLVSEGLLDRSRDLGYELRLSLQQLAADFPAVFSEARGQGFLCGIEVTEAATVAGLSRLRTLLIEHGVYAELMAGAGRRSGGLRFAFPCLRIAPPLIATQDELEEITERLRRGVEAFAAEI